MEYFAGEYEVLVVGAGHAGIEAALAAARLGCKTAIFTINMDAVGNCPCNPSVGGTAKGHLVREIDALGGEMGKTADECFLQSRMLNKGKGPAVHSLRVQIDREKYKSTMKYKLEKQKNLHLMQAEIIEISQTENKKWKIVTRLNAVYLSRTVVIATGTYLESKIFVGEVSFESGPDGIFPSKFLGDSLKKLGLNLRRFKTGTPARVLKSSIDFSKLEVQKGDEKIIPFSYETKNLGKNLVDCYIGYTTEKTKEIILKNISRSALFSGKIEGKGPRYCPSIEDKFVRFSDKERHQFFVEPCGLNTDEMYVQGLSSSLPEEVQKQFYKTLPGFENVLIMRPAYAIEYYCVDPIQMNSSLEFKDFSGLFGAGQFNGSSGYEEAAAQGLIAGINAALKVLNKDALKLSRESSYIGTLIDDLVTKGVSDPYRMMTSRSEYRLVLRQDNADERLTPIGRKIGLISDERWSIFENKQILKKQEIKRISNLVISPSEAVNKIIVSRGTSKILSGVKMIDLLKRPQLTYENLVKIDKNRPNIDSSIFEQIEVEIKYEGYIKKQLAQIENAKRLEKNVLPKNIDYSKIIGLRLEAKEKLNLVKPENIGQASRISGVSPADISVLLIWLAQENRKKVQNGGV